MKKIFTLAFLAMFCLGAVAQIELGNIKFSLGEGKKINPVTGKIVVTFPDVKGVDDPTATTFVLEGNFSDGTGFDGVEATFAEGVTFDLGEYELQPSTDYTLSITSVKVDGVELAPEGGYQLNFKTRGAERKMSWNFVVPDDEMAIIKADADADNGGAQVYWSPVKVNERYYIKQSLKYDEIMLDANNVLSVTEDLMFNFGSEKAYIGDPSSSSWKGILCFNNNNMQMTIPDCKAGDVITFNAVYATKASTSKFPVIQAMNGGAIAPEGLVSSTGLQDSINLGSKYANYKFEALVDGDITFNFGQCRLKTIDITEAQPKLPRNYNVVAAYTPEGGEPVILKELVPKTEGTTGSTVKVNYPYWLTDSEGNVYTHGTKGSEFIESFDLVNGEGDVTFTINYSKTDYTGVVYLTEGEDIEGAVLCTNGNAAIRSSMGKAAYVAEDTKLVTLQPGSYKIRAVVFDAAKTPGYVCTLSTGEGEQNEIYLTATATNWTEAESDLLTFTEATDITLKAGGGADKGLDVIMIYASEDAPEDPEEPRNYSVVAVYKDGDGNQKVLKELVPTTSGMVGDEIKVPYSVWLADSEGVLYTKGATNKEYNAVFTLESGEGDAQFVIEYAKEGTENVTFLAEGENIEGATACTSCNAAIRSSNSAAAYFAADTKIATLQPGYYMVKAVLFDAAKEENINYVFTLVYGGNGVSFPAKKTNWTDVNTEYTLNITKPTDLIIKAGGSETAGLDAIAIYTVREAVNPPVKGDMNGDGKVDALDIQTIIMACANDLTDSKFDITGDGKVDALDIQTIIMIACFS